ncbi:MAG: hypothetical protein MUE85_04255 [Microscillaceae bacterium]|jgi:hypothetical protein|nr:hypothetical protein [Microscillaceae bacterium]
MKTLFLNLYQRNHWLTWVGCTFLLMALPALLLMMIDNRLILGINPWIKPLKFMLSAGAYVLTMAWLLDFFRENPRKVRRYANWIAWAMIVEIVLITVQAIRGVPSHFNNTSGLNSLIFSTMGGFILINTIIIVLIIIDLFRLRAQAGLIETDMLWAVRLGMILFLLGSLEAGFMLRLNAHTVGAPDGGVGLPFLNWSRQFGDLRIAHFVGIHAIQVLPCVVWINQKYNIWQSSSIGKVGIVWLGSLLIFSLLAFTLWQALSQMPLVALQ